VEGRGFYSQHELARRGELALLRQFDGHDLREITQKIRPDWDLAAPGLREAWQRGDKSRFWPYNRSLKEVLAEAS